jgi:hypothetical protein
VFSTAFSFVEVVELVPEIPSSATAEEASSYRHASASVKECGTDEATKRHQEAFLKLGIRPCAGNDPRPLHVCTDSVNGLAHSCDLIHSNHVFGHEELQQRFGETLPRRLGPLLIDGQLLQLVSWEMGMVVVVVMMVVVVVVVVMAVTVLKLVQRGALRGRRKCSPVGGEPRLVHVGTYFVVAALLRPHIALFERDAIQVVLLIGLSGKGEELRISEQS